MAITVKVVVKGEIEDVLEEVKKIAAQKGIKFSGNVSKGTFEGEGIEGNYSVKEKEITIVVTKSPWYAPDSSVKSAIQEWFKGK